MEDLRDLPRNVSACCLIIVLLLTGCNGERPAAQKISVVDGDTLLVEAEGQTPFKVELAFIDAPEREQPYGRKARNLLNELIQGYSRSIKQTESELEHEGIKVNLELVKMGAAWVTRKIDDPLVAMEYMQAQENAKLNFRGVWGLEHGLRVPPWVWRTQAKERLNKPPRVVRPPQFRPPSGQPVRPAEKTIKKGKKDENLQ